MLLDVILDNSICARLNAAWLSSHTVDIDDFCSPAICLISSNSVSKFHTGNKSHVAVLNAMYSSSIVITKCDELFLNSVQCDFALQSTNPYYW